MAGANLPAKKYSKTSPTVTRLSFECSGNTTRFIDTALSLSAINRKFARQGVYFYINSVEVYNNSTGVVDLHTLPDTWVTKNAWNRGFKLFQKMNSMVDDVSAIGRPKYHDFKVYMNSMHRSSGSLSPSLYGINGTESSTVNPDNWMYSQFVSADDDQDGTANADEFYVHMIGDHDGNTDNWNSIGLIKSYADSRARPDPSGDPVLPVESREDPLVNIFDFSSEEQINDIVENLDLHNDDPPYDGDRYVGVIENSLQHVARIGTEVGVGRVGRASGFCAPFGLICVDPWGLPPEDNFRVVLNLAVGTYHGVYAERA